MWLCRARNKDKSTSSKLLRKEKENNNDSINRNSLICIRNQCQGQQWRNNNLCFWHYEKINCKQRGPKTRPMRSYRKSWSPRTWRSRRMLQPPIIHIINQKLQGISWQFWSGLRDHFREKNRIHGSVQKAQRKYEAVHTTIVTEPWRHHRSGQGLKTPHSFFKHINTHIATNGRG